MCHQWLFFAPTRNVARLGAAMKSIPDSAGEDRRAWLRAMQDDLVPIQSDFETSLAWRVALGVAALVILFNVLAPSPVSVAAKPAHMRGTV